DTPEGAKRAWDKALADVDRSSAKPYNMTSSFEVGDVIAHKKFGDGIVNQALGESKVEVLFEDGLKRLVCNWKK
ncbi:MAG: hypothetical protein KC561_14790, partial [Myxococcales bacterium]|nr:hypothetical protein [Myxococcales bacterium]